MTPPDAFHVSRLELDALALGALSHEARARLAHHLASCPRCQEAADAAAQDHQAFAREVLPATLPAIRERLAAPIPPGRRTATGWWGGGLALALAAGLAALVVLPRHASPAGGEEYLGVKGESSALQVFVRRGERIWRAAPGEALRPGDEVRFTVEPAGHAYVLLASVDATGAAFVYHPYAGERSARVEGGAATAELPGSIVLDAAGPERVFVLLSDAPLAAESALAPLRRLGAAGADAIRSQARIPVAGVEAQGSFLIEKVQP